MAQNRNQNCGSLIFAPPGRKRLTTPPSSSLKRKEVLINLVDDEDQENDESENSDDDHDPPSPRTQARVLAAAQARFQPHPQPERVYERFVVAGVGISGVRDTRRVLQPVWLDGTQINLIGEILQHEYPHIIYRSSNHLWVSEQGKAEARLKRLIDQQADWSKRFIFMPVNIENIHWVLIAIDLAMNQLLFCDSISGHTSPSRRLVLLSCVKHRLEEVWRVFEGKEPRPWQLDDEFPCPQQQGGVDCGAYVCYFMQMLATLSNTSSLTTPIALNPHLKLDITGYRQDLFKLVQKYRA
jgi:Ulp1 protease family, C-terminal catalytic domain